MGRPDCALRRSARVVSAACLGLLLAAAAHPAFAGEGGGPSGVVSGLASGVAAASAQPSTSGERAALAATAAQASVGAGNAAVGSRANASGPLYSLDAQGNAVITGYAGTVSQLSVPATIDGHSVTAIGASAFQGNASLTAVTLPSSVTAVGDYAFADCPKLAKVDLGEGLASLGAGAFLGDTALRQIATPATLVGCGMVWTGTEGTGPFGACANLASVELASGMTAVPAYLLTGCSSAALEIAVPASVTAFGTDALALTAGPQALTVVADPGTFAQQYAEQNGLAWRDPNVHATGVTLNVGSLNLKNGTSQQLSASIEPRGVTDPVTWSSSNPAVARVDAQGKVTALKAGAATVTVSVSGLTASCDVAVWQPVLSIELNRGAFSAEAAEERQLVAACLPADATNKAVTWSSSNPAVAAVNAQTGLVTTVGEGTCTITATAADGAGAKQACTVTVTSNSYTASTVEELTSPHPYANSCADAWVYTVPGAQVINVSFDQRTMAENTFDYIEVYDGSGSLMGAYTGSELAGATLTLPGDTVRVKLDTDAEVDAWGFAAASVTAVEPQGWIGIAGLTYYYVDGRPCYGEQWIDGAWYYFDPRSGAMVTGFVKLPNGPIRYYNHHGAMVTGSLTIAGRNYDFDVNTGDLVVDNSVNIEVNNVTNNTTVNNNTVVVIDQDITVNPEPPAPGPDEPDPQPPVEPVPWNLAVDDLGHVTTDYFEFDLPQPWLDRVEVSMAVHEDGETLCRVTLPQQPDAVLAAFRLGDPATSETAMGDIATQHAANWNNGNSQVVELWTRNWPWLATEGSDGSLSDAELAELVLLSTGDALTLDQAREQVAGGTLAIASYAASAIIPTVRVPLYGADGEVQGAAEPQVFFDGAQPEQPSESENPGDPQAPAEPESAENPSEPEAPAEPQVPEQPENPNETEILGDPGQPDAAEQPSDSGQPATPEGDPATQGLTESQAPAESEQPAEPAAQEPQPVPELSLDDAQSYQALNRLLTDFATGYPGVAYSAEQPVPSQEEPLALLGVDQVVREQATPGLPADQLVPIEVIENGDNPWGDPSLNARIPIDPVLAAVKALTNAEADPALLANGFMARYDGGYLYYTAQQVGNRSGIALAQSLERQDEATYRVTFAEYGGPVSAPSVAVDTNDASLLALAGADLAQRLGVEGPTPRVGAAVVRLVAVDDSATGNAPGSDFSSMADGAFDSAPASDSASAGANAQVAPSAWGVVVAGYRLVVVEFSFDYPEGYVAPAPEPVAEPGLEAALAPEVTAEPTPTPEPAPDPAAEPAPTPGSAPDPAPEVAPEPDPAPESTGADAADLGLEGMPGVEEALDAVGVELASS